ncbi:hypothetical protein F5Y18DRAFT_225632 [Xylariaceae sp. FL1019]|nr:hypothetical protein F5Y18DRAFT_225632 [Xylariaceae sp. FL1019]
MSESQSESRGPRIAIKFGASSTSAPRSANNGTKLPSQYHATALGKRQRPNALRDDSDSADEDDGLGEHVAVTTLGVDTRNANKRHKSLEGSKTDQGYVISSQRDRDWKGILKARRTNKVPRLGENQTEIELADQDKDIKWGLNLAKKSAQESSKAGRIKDPQTEADRATPAALSSSPGSKPHVTEDEDRNAMDALLGKRRQKQEFIINGPKNETNQPRFSEQDSLQQGIQEAGEVSTLDEYDNIPEEEFGAAMLRGMGWNGDMVGSKSNNSIRRSHLMGLGSKEDEEIKQGELAKKHGYRDRRPRLDEYKRDRARDKEDRERRYKDRSYRSGREIEQREHGDRYRDSDSHKHRSRHHRS